MTYRRHFLRVFDSQKGITFDLLFVSAPEREAARSNLEKMGFYSEKITSAEFFGGVSCDGSNY